MKLIAAGAEAYAITGGIQIESCEILSKSAWQYKDVHPTTKAQLRDSDDKKPTWMNTILGKTINSSNAVLPVIDDRTSPAYKVYKGTAIDCYEIAGDKAAGILTAALKMGSTLKKLELLSACLNIQDVTEDGVTKIVDKIDTTWSEIEGITTYTGSDDNIAASGCPVLESFSFTYNDLIKLGQLKVKLIE